MKNPNRKNCQIQTRVNIKQTAPIKPYHSLFITFFVLLFHYFSFCVDVPTYEIDPEYRNDGNFTIFSNVVYLGSVNLQAPKSEAEILQ